jgi:hypothetical protein
MLPKGWITQDGPKPEYAKLYGMSQHTNASYPPRTEVNAKEGDGTIRFAANFNSAGEKCTLKFINKHNKPYIDVDIHNPISVHDVIAWILENEIKVLNVAGNAEKTAAGIEAFVTEYLIGVFSRLPTEKPKSKKKKCAVAFLGERDFTDYESFVKVVRAYNKPITEIVVGDNQGVDFLAEQFAQANKIKVTKYLIDWETLDVPGAVVKNGKYGPYNSRAAFDRNQKIVDRADVGIAVQASGMDTTDMIKKFTKAGKEVFSLQQVESSDIYNF